MPYFDRPDGKIYYEMKGDAKQTAVLLNGLGCTSQHWVGWEKLLTNEFQIITLDNRGLGRSTTKIRPWHSISTLSTDVKSLLDHLKVDKAHIMGVSLGGMIALDFALNHPEATLSVTPVNSSVGGSGHLRISLEGLRLLSSRKKDHNFYKKLAAILTSENSSDVAKSKISSRWFELDSETPPSAKSVIGQLVAASRWSPWRSFKDIKAPTHIVFGADDVFVRPGNSLFLSEKTPHAKVSEMKNCGHEPGIDQPELFKTIICDFWKSID
jgi:pimeloyl-ACP methyl ester carboxylesterase